MTRHTYRLPRRVSHWRHSYAPAAATTIQIRGSDVVIGDSSLALREAARRARETQAEAAR